MFADKTVAVVVPAHNEQRLIARAVEQIPRFVDHIIVVDDASSDNTSKALEKFALRPGFHYIRHHVNKGVGGAIVSGYRFALGIGVDVVAVMAGDAQMDPVDLPRLLSPIARGEADYVKGDRLSQPGSFAKMPLARFLGNHVLSQITRFTSGYWEVSDSQCGYAALSVSMLRRLDLERLYQRYGFPNDILAHLHTLNARLAQVPVRPVYGTETSEISLYTAVVGVPLVLLRSLVLRLKREGSPKLLTPQGDRF